MEISIRTKKLIAREFLLILTLVGICTIAYFVIDILNWQTENKLTGINLKIAATTIKCDSLSKVYIDRVRSSLSNGESKTAKIYRQIILLDPTYKDDISYEQFIIKIYREPYCKTILKWIDSNDASAFQKFIDAEINQDIETKIGADLIRKYKESLDSNQLYFEDKKNILGSIISSNGKRSILEQTFFISLFALFILRYLFYAIKWSISVLTISEHKNNDT